MSGRSSLSWSSDTDLSVFKVTFFIMIPSLIFGCLIHRPMGVDACTASFVKERGFFLKSYDWHDGNGELYFNPRNHERSAFPHEGQSKTADDPQGIALSWISKYASVSFNQYGRGFPNGGMNERGLAIEVLWLEESEAPPKDHRPYVNELEWVQYVLDSCSHVAEVLKEIDHVRVSPIHAKLHYLFCDQEGECGALEFINGERRLSSKDSGVFTLTNHSYEESNTYRSRLNNRPAASSVGRGSLDRFVSAWHISNDASIHTLEEGLQRLDQVKIEGDTKWQIAYQLNRLELIFRVGDSSNLRMVSLPRLLDMSKQKDKRAPPCSSVMTYSLLGKHEGELSAHFHSPSIRSERKRLRERFSKLNLPGDLADKMASHSANCPRSKIR